MNCSACRFKSNKAGAQFSAGVHIFCLHFRAFFPNDHGCDEGKGRDNGKQERDLTC